MRAEVKKIDEKTFRVMLGNHEIGTSKTDFDARFHVNAINDALEVSFLEGQKYLERSVEHNRLGLELQMLEFKEIAEREEARKAQNQVPNSSPKSSP